jgi:plastocyanin
VNRGWTPGRVAARSGVAFCMAWVLLVGCEAADRRATIQLDTAEVELGRGARVLEVAIAGTGAVDSIAPGQFSASPGDAVRFVVEDHRTHALAFDADRLEPRVREYLEATNQLRGPPLVTRGATWVVVLEDAPPGRYPFLCRSHDARGLLTVTGGD